MFEVGASHAWYDDRWARGAFALFEPEQQTQLQADIVKPEGRVYFAGEHSSLYHAWIQGALESGIRAAREIHEAGRAEGNGSVRARPPRACGRPPPPTPSAALAHGQRRPPASHMAKRSWGDS